MKMTIRNKMLIWFLSMGLIPLLLIAVIATIINKQALSDRIFSQLENAREIKTEQIIAYVDEREDDLAILMDTVDSLRQAAFNKLKSAQENKKAQILTYFHKTAKDLEVISKSLVVTQALSDFRSVIDEKGTFDTLLYDFFETEKYGATLVKFRDIYRYHDLLLVTAGGRVVYASRRGQALGKDLAATGPSPLSRCYTGGLEGLTFQDFSPDEDLDGRQVALFGCPIRSRDNSLLGVAILKITPDAVNEIMLRSQGMGDTGETYLFRIAKGAATLRSRRAGRNVGDPLEDFPRKQELFAPVKPKIRIRPTGEADIAIFEPVPVFDTTYILSTKIALGEVIDPRFQDQNLDYFSKYITVYGYKNLYLISPTGHIFYNTVADGQTPNLNAVNNPGLFALHNKIMATAAPNPSPVFMDFSTAPGDDQPYAYIGAPLMSGNRIELVVALKISSDGFNTIMETHKGIGTTYDLYLVGPDFKFRSDSFLLPETHTVTRSFSAADSPGVDTLPVRRALEGSTGLTFAVNDRSTEVLSAFAPLDIMGSRWAILAEIDKSEAFAPLTLFYLLVCAATLVTAGLLFAFSLYASRRLSAPILALKTAAERVKETNYDIHVDVRSKDELGLLGDAFNDMTLTVKQRSLALELKILQLEEAQTEIRKSEERFRSLVETTADWIWEVDQTGVYTYASPKVKDILGYLPEEIVGKTPFDLMPEAEKERVSRIFTEIVAAGQPFTGLENLNAHRDGTILNLETSGVPFFDEDGELLGYRGIDRDISNRKKNEEALLMTESVFKNTIEGIAITDREGTIARVNQAFCDITGYSEAEVLGKNPRVLKSDRHDEGFYKTMWQEILDQGQWSGEIWNRRKDGSAYPEWLSISAIRNPKGEITNFVSLFHDISEKKLKEEQLQFLAFHDPLTHLPNRKLLYDRAEVSIRNARRNAQKVALLYMDLDNFKNINDSYGHPFGDEFLIQVKNRIQTICRESDTFARYGGDEFVIVLNNIAREEEVIDFSNRILDLFKTPVTIMEEEVFTSMSIGLAIFPDDGEDLVTLEKHADMALYEAKRDGKRRSFHFKQGLKDKMLRKIKLENTLRAATRDFAGFAVAYQPKVDAKEGHRINGVEALLRWTVDGTPVSPAEFIPLAEETNLIIPIGEWLMKTAMTHIKAIHDMGCPSLNLSINLSTKQFNDDQLFTVIEKIIGETGFPPKRLCFEITESIPMEDARRAVRIMHHLVDLGIQLSMDDFGTGYSSLSVLKNFPLSELKIDRSFVRDLPANESDAAICKTIIHMARSLDFQVVAEGVETDAQYDFFKANNCDLIQGFRFYKPMGHQELQTLISKC